MNLRNEIEKAIQESAAWNIVQNGTGEWSYGHEYPFNLDQAISQILSLIEAIVPPEKSIEIPSQYGLKMTDRVEGYNQCIADIKKRLGDE